MRKRAAPGKEVAILIQAIQCLIQRGARVGNPGGLLGWKVIKILVHRVTWMKLVLDTVQPSHHQCSESKIRVSGRIGKTHFDAPSLGTVGVGNTHCRGTVAYRISK